MKTYFENFGEVSDTKVIYNLENNKPRGFGFVIFKHEKSAKKVLDKYEDHYLGGKWVDCKSTYQKDDFEMIITTYDDPSPQVELISSEKVTEHSQGSTKRENQNNKNRNKTGGRQFQPSVKKGYDGPVGDIAVKLVGGPEPPITYQYSKAYSRKQDIDYMQEEKDIAKSKKLREEKKLLSKGN
jgi:RNA recognition motif-containing protein